MIKNIHTTLFEQGKIKIGGKGKEKTSSGGKKYQEPLKLDHFLITTLERDNTPEGNFKVDEKAMSGLPEKPEIIPVEFLYDDIDLNFPTCYSMFGKDGLFCRGDGETATREGKEIVCNPDTCQYSKSKSCKISGILLCRLPHLKNLMGVYKFRTHSWHSVKNILAALQYIQTLTGGIVGGLPFELRLERKPTKFGVVKIVNLVFPGDNDILAEELAKEVTRRQKLKFDIARVEQAAVISGVTLDTDDPEDVAAEFFPGSSEEIQEETPATTEPKRTKADQLNALFDAIEILTEGRNPQHMENSLKKNLDVSALRDCQDAAQIFKYYNHVVESMVAEIDKHPTRAADLSELFLAECAAKRFDSALRIYREALQYESLNFTQADLEGMLDAVSEFTPEQADAFTTSADAKDFATCQALFDKALTVKK